MLYLTSALNWLLAGDIITLSSFAIFLLFSLGLRWFVFDYYGMSWFQQALVGSGIPLVQSLASCIYCQTIEVSIVVYLLLARGYSPVVCLLAVLANGMLAMTIVPLASLLIMEWEAQKEHNDEEFEVDEPLEL